MLNTVVVGVPQILQYCRQITWFLGNNRALSKFKQWILNYLINSMKLENN